MKKRRSVKLPSDVVATLAGLWEGSRPGDSIGALLRLLVSCPSAALDLASPGSPRASWSSRDAEPTRVTVRLEESEWAALVDLAEPLAVSDAAQAAKVLASLLARRPASLRALGGARANTTPGAQANANGARANTMCDARAPSGARANTTPGAQASTTWCAREHHATEGVDVPAARDLRLEEEEEEDLLLSGLGRDPVEVWREGCRLLGPAGPRASHAPGVLEAGAMALTLELVEERVEDPKARRGYGVKVWRDVSTDPDRVRCWLGDRAEARAKRHASEELAKAMRAGQELLAARRQACEAEVRAWSRERRSAEAKRLGVAPVWVNALAEGENELALGELAGAMASAS